MQLKHRFLSFFTLSLVFIYTCVFALTCYLVYTYLEEVYTKADIQQVQYNVQGINDQLTLVDKLTNKYGQAIIENELLKRKQTDLYGTYDVLDMFILVQGDKLLYNDLKDKNTGEIKQSPEFFTNEVKIIHLKVEDGRTESGLYQMGNNMMAVSFVKIPNTNISVVGGRYIKFRADDFRSDYGELRPISLEEKEELIASSKVVKAFEDYGRNVTLYESKKQEGIFTFIHGINNYSDFLLAVDTGAEFEKSTQRMLSFILVGMIGFNVLGIVITYQLISRVFLNRFYKILKRIKGPDSDSDESVNELQTIEDRIEKLTEEINQSKLLNYRMAHHDSVTGIYNRNYFVTQYEKAKVCGEKMAFVYLDIDKFKRINDKYGHAVADDVLRESVRRIQRSLPDNTFVARIANDEFVVVLKNYHTMGQVVGIVKQLQKEFLHTFYVGDHEMKLTTSVGIAYFPDDDGNIDVILKGLNDAMQVVKKNGGNGLLEYNKIRKDEDIE